jgi:cytochrome b6-f complex iron-sulfur subunit
MKRPIDRYVDSLLRRRRPRPFAPSEEDLAVARTAIDLAAAGPDAQRPSEAFVEDLRRRLAAQQTADSRPSPAALPVGRRTVGRRRFLAAGALTATAAAGAAAGHALTEPSPASATEAELRPTTGTWQAVAASADLPEGAVVPFDLGTVTGFLQRVSGRLRAVSGICTHQGCRLNLTPPRDQLVCPCHGATFTLAGQPLTHPHNNHALAALPRLPVRVSGDRIQVYAPASPAPGAPGEVMPDQA